MKRKNNYIGLLSFCLLLFWSCEEDVSLDFPELEKKYVVEGIIETGLPPFVFLTKSQSFNQNFNAQSLESAFVHDAEVKVSSSQEEFLLQEICLSEIPDSLWPVLSTLIGVSIEDLENLNYCIYSTLDVNAFGEEGKRYDLQIAVNGDSLYASTRIDAAVDLDSIWFELWSDEDSLGFVYALLSDPDTLGNAYRWAARRMNKNKNGEVKDNRFLYPLGSSFDDKFFNGLTFEFGYNRGQEQNSNAEDDTGSESGFFRLGDTIAVKFSSIPVEAYRFYRSLENQVGSNGSPFASPDNLSTNIIGGLGIWVGYGPVIDTVLAYP